MMLVFAVAAILSAWSPSNTTVENDPLKKIEDKLKFRPLVIGSPPHCRLVSAKLSRMKFGNEVTQRQVIWLSYNCAKGSVNLFECPKKKGDRSKVAYDIVGQGAFRFPTHVGDVLEYPIYDGIDAVVIIRSHQGLDSGIQLIPYKK